jgi:hypothetical protein
MTSSNLASALDDRVVLEAAKFAAITATAIFGAIGAAFETHDRDRAGKKRLNTWGLASIAGIGLSFLLAIVTQSVELRIDKAERADAKRDRDSSLAQQRLTLDSLKANLKASRGLFAKMAASESTQRGILSLTDSSYHVGLSQQHIVTAALETGVHVLYETSRSQFPLWPLEYEFEIEYPLDAPVFGGKPREVLARFPHLRTGLGVIIYPNDTAFADTVRYKAALELLWRPEATAREALQK